MEDQLTHDSRHAKRFAGGLFRDWQDELPNGPLRSRVEHLSCVYQELSPDELLLHVVFDGTGGAGLYGSWQVDGRCELVGPYVRKGLRVRGFGRLMLGASCRNLSWSPDVHLLVPADNYWAIEKLTAYGFNQIDTNIPDGTGDHRAFHANQIQRATQALRRAGEPITKGNWGVRLENDDTTPLDFVVRTLSRVLDVNTQLAYEFALLVHFTGNTHVRYCRTERGARKLAERIMKLARMDDFPLTANVVRR